MATLNPMERSYEAAPPSVSKKTFLIAGIVTTVYGLDEISPDIENVTCLWLLHPRGQSQACMEVTAFTAITTWNQTIALKRDRGPPLGLIAVSFDQRNHGSREIEKLANEAWKTGNEKHAQDMFSIYRSSPVKPPETIISDLHRGYGLRYLSADNIPTSLCVPKLCSYCNR